MLMKLQEFGLKYETASPWSGSENTSTSCLT